MIARRRIGADRGETLVEGIAALGIIGLVLVVLVGLVGSALALGSVRDAQARSDASLRSLYESVTAYRAPSGGPLTCSDTMAIADIQRIVTTTPLAGGVSAAAPEVFARFLPATSSAPSAVTSSVACPSSAAPVDAVPVGLAVTLRVTAAGAGPLGSWTDTMTAFVGRST